MIGGPRNTLGKRIAKMTNQAKRGEAVDPLRPLSSLALSLAASLIRTDLDISVARHPFWHFLESLVPAGSFGLASNGATSKESSGCLINCARRLYSEYSSSKEPLR